MMMKFCVYVCLFFSWVGYKPTTAEAHLYNRSSLGPETRDSTSIGGKEGRGPPLFCRKRESSLSVESVFVGSRSTPTNLDGLGKWTRWIPYSICAVLSCAVLCCTRDEITNLTVSIWFSGLANFGFPFFYFLVIDRVVSIGFLVVTKQYRPANRGLTPSTLGTFGTMVI